MIVLSRSSSGQKLVAWVWLRRTTGWFVQEEVHLGRMRSVTLTQGKRFLIGAVLGLDKESWTKIGCLRTKTVQNQELNKYFQKLSDQLKPGSNKIWRSVDPIVRFQNTKKYLGPKIFLEYDI